MFRQARLFLDGLLARSTSIEIASDVLQVKAGSVGTTQLADGSVTSAKLAAAVAGAGLVGGAGSPLDVNPDGSTLEVVSDQVRVKDGGITQAKAATGLRMHFVQASTPTGVEGDTWSDTANDRLLIYTGSAWRELFAYSSTGLHTWTPTFYFGITAVTNGNATINAQYQLNGLYVDVWMAFTVGSTTNINGGTGAFNFSLPSGVVPIMPTGSNPFPVLGTVNLLHAGVGRTTRIALLNTDAGTDRVIASDMAWGANPITHNNPSVWTVAGSEIVFNLRYRWTN